MIFKHLMREPSVNPQRAAEESGRKLERAKLLEKSLFAAQLEMGIYMNKIFPKKLSGKSEKIGRVYHPEIRYLRYPSHTHSVPLILQFNIYPYLVLGFSIVHQSDLLHLISRPLRIMKSIWPGCVLTEAVKSKRR